jgi:bifunctional DNase/RNase
MVEVGLKCVMKEPVTDRCIILLESLSGLEVLPLPVGEDSAEVIHSFMCGKQTRNDGGIISGFAELISSFDNAFPERVVIDSYKVGVFTSKVYFIVNGEERVVDARPSDALRFALFAKVPMYVAETIISGTCTDRKLCFQQKGKCCG